MEEEKEEGTEVWKVLRVRQYPARFPCWKQSTPGWRRPTRRWPASEGPSRAGCLWRGQVCFPSGTADCRSQGRTGWTACT